ncbi:MAG: transposase [Rhodanobacteraceae bacterium]|nr:transposase [Rhodanobacteraceae bacterium]
MNLQREWALSSAPHKAHCRREFFDAQSSDPEGVAQALELIGALYEIEQDIRDRKLVTEDKQTFRATHSKPRIE